MPMRSELPKQDEIIFKLNEIVEHELAGVVWYTHYSFMIFDSERGPNPVRFDRSVGCISVKYPG
jgi:hypothetical protein